MASRRLDPPPTAWRVSVLDDASAGRGLLRAYAGLFTIPDYWDYGLFEPRADCRLSGHGFGTAARGQAGHQEVWFAPG